MPTYAYNSFSSPFVFMRSNYSFDLPSQIQQITIGGITYEGYAIDNISGSEYSYYNPPFGGGIPSFQQLYNYDRQIVSINGAPGQLSSNGTISYDNFYYINGGPPGTVNGISPYGISYLTSDGGFGVIRSNGVNLESNSYNNATPPVRNGGGTLEDRTPCYASGTLIQTVAGNVAVEDLRVGDLVITGSGDRRPVRWVGHSTVACRQNPKPRNVYPVRIARHAVGPNKPARDLYVSPEHAIAVTIVDEEVLIAAHRLVNGATIAQVEVETVTYWHVELDSHDILIANGLPAESYIDCGNRSFFTGCQGEAARAPSGSLAAYCRPLADETVVRAVRSRLRARALDLGWQLATDPLADLHVVADGRVVRPDVLGTRARFVLPVDAQEVWLMSDTGVPAETGESGDIRRLGVSLSGMSVDDGLTGCREIALDDPRLGEGFHVLEEDGARHRWTDGRARLPASLWAGCCGQVFVRVELLEGGMLRWVPPVASAQPVAQAPRLVWSA